MTTEFQYFLKIHVLTDVSVIHLPDYVRSPTRSTFPAVHAVSGMSTAQ